MDIRSQIHRLYDSDADNDGSDNNLPGVDNDKPGTQPDDDSKAKELEMVAAERDELKANSIKLQAQIDELNKPKPKEPDVKPVPPEATFNDKLDSFKALYADKDEILLDEYTGELLKFMEAERFSPIEKKIALMEAKLIQSNAMVDGKLFLRDFENPDEVEGHLKEGMKQVEEAYAKAKAGNINPMLDIIKKMKGIDNLPKRDKRSTEIKTGDGGDEPPKDDVKELRDSIAKELKDLHPQIDI